MPTQNPAPPRSLWWKWQISVGPPLDQTPGSALSPLSLPDESDSTCEWLAAGEAPLILTSYWLISPPSLPLFSAPYSAVLGWKHRFTGPITTTQHSRQTQRWKLECLVALCRALLHPLQGVHSVYTQNLCITILERAKKWSAKNILKHFFPQNMLKLVWAAQKSCLRGPWTDRQPDSRSHRQGDNMTLKTNAKRNCKNHPHDHHLLGALQC